MTLTLPKISIIMPVLNRKTMIARAIQSVLKQQYPNIELIVLDGGSTDGTVDVIEQYQQHIAYWHSQPDGCCTESINAGIEKASGDLIVILMSDDWFEAGLFFKIAKAYQTHDVDILVCGGRRIAYQPASEHYVEQINFMSTRKQTFTLFNTCLNAYFAICCCFIKPSVFKRIGLFMPYLNGQVFVANDREWVIRAALYPVSSYVVPFLGYTYCAHDGSISFGNNARNIIRISEEHQWIAQHFLANKQLSRAQRATLLCWRYEQLAYLFYLYLLQKEWRNSMAAMRQGFKDSVLLWTSIFTFVTVRALVRKCWRWLAGSPVLSI